jgi:BlaI family penicillinase repressor
VSHHLGDLQLAIMRVLWDREAATVAEVHQALHDDRGLALTTIATMLSKMEKKGVVKHQRQGRQFVYRPTVAEHEVQATMVESLTEQLFGGNITALVSRLLSAREVQPGELAELKKLIAAHERKER